MYNCKYSKPLYNMYFLKEKNLVVLGLYCSIKDIHFPVINC